MKMYLISVKVCFYRCFETYFNFIFSTFSASSVCSRYIYILLKIIIIIKVYIKFLNALRISKNMSNKSLKTYENQKGHSKKINSDILVCDKLHVSLYLTKN